MEKIDAHKNSLLNFFVDKNEENDVMKTHGHYLTIHLFKPHPTIPSCFDTFQCPNMEEANKIMALEPDAKWFVIDNNKWKGENNV